MSEASSPFHLIDRHLHRYLASLVCSGPYMDASTGRTQYRNEGVNTFSTLSRLVMMEVAPTYLHQLTGHGNRLRWEDGTGASLSIRLKGMNCTSELENTRILVRNGGFPSTYSCREKCWTYKWDGGKECCVEIIPRNEGILTFANYRAYPSVDPTRHNGYSTMEKASKGVRLLRSSLLLPPTMRFCSPRTLSDVDEVSLLPHPHLVAAQSGVEPPPGLPHPLGWIEGMNKFPLTLERYLALWLWRGGSNISPPRETRRYRDRLVCDGPCLQLWYQNFEEALWYWTGVSPSMERAPRDEKSESQSLPDVGLVSSLGRGSSEKSRLRDVLNSDAPCPIQRSRGSRVVPWKEDEAVSTDRMHFTPYGVCHRGGDLPASIDSHWTREWFFHGRRHRDGGKPAVIRGDGRREYWVEGELKELSVGPPPCLLSVIVPSLPGSEKGAFIHSEQGKRLPLNEGPVKYQRTRNSTGVIDRSFSGLIEARTESGVRATSETAIESLPLIGTDRGLLGEGRDPLFVFDSDV